MKKLLVIALVGLMMLAFTFGCGKKEEPAPQTEPPVTETPAEDTGMTMDTMETMDTTMMEEPMEDPSEGEGE